MQVLIANCDKTHYFITVDEVSNEFTFLHITINDDLLETLHTLTYEIHWSITNLHWCKGEISEFYSLVEHVHCCEESCLHVILKIISSESHLVNE